jgi:hypothetical protein
MILGACTTLAVSRIVTARKSFPIARETSFNETAGDIIVLNKTLSDCTVSIFWRGPSVARSAATNRDTAHLLAFNKSTQRSACLIVPRTLPFRGVNATQANARARTAVSANLDVITVNDGPHLDGKLGSIARCYGGSPKNRKSHDLQKSHCHSDG